MPCNVEVHQTKLINQVELINSFDTTQFENRMFRGFLNLQTGSWLKLFLLNKYANEKMFMLKRVFFLSWAKII